MIRKSLFIIGNILFVLVIPTQAQLTEKQRVDQAANQITSLLNSGRPDSSQFYVCDIVDVDSSVGDVNTYFGQLQDPYGTLKGSFIFIAEAPYPDGYKNEVGVFKDGQILWDSGPIIDGVLGRIFATMDLTNSGKVDVIATWIEGGSGASSGMWIFSWDGKKGMPINPYDEFGSGIVGNRSGFLIEDINGNGKYVITTQLDTADVVYSWNGTSFQTIVNPPVLVNNTFSPANNFSATISATGETSSGGYEYNYTVSSMPSSAQSINNIMIAACLDSVKEYAPKGWNCLGVKAASLSRFVNDIDLENFVKPGMSLKGFEIISGCPPGISQYYAQAPHKVPSYKPEEFMAHLSEFTDDFLNNSVKGFTIAPAKPPSPFAPLAFLDTLVSYKHQCVTLGWLTNGPAHEKDESDDRADEGIVERLDRRLGKAKIALAKNDSVKARLELELFVKEVELLDGLGKKSEMRNKKSVLTSEGYALLKYNAEYLIEKLPERHGRGDEGEHRGKK